LLIPLVGPAGLTSISAINHLGVSETGENPDVSRCLSHSVSPKRKPVTEGRAYCRRCRVKLAKPTENQRSAFCCRGCYRLFYAGQCLVCEGSMKRNAGHQLVCSRPACKIEFRTLKRHGVLGGFYGSKTAVGHHPSPNVVRPSADPAKIGVSEDARAPREVRQVAGPRLSPEQLRLAILGSPLEQDRKLNRRHHLDAERVEIESAGCFEDTEWCEAISPDGVRCLVADATRSVP
jgi:hypothetical protein